MKEAMAGRIQHLRQQTYMTQVDLACKIELSKSQFIRYGSKNIQLSADIVNQLAHISCTSVDYLISGDRIERENVTLQNSELLQRFKETDVLPDQVQGRNSA